jgi:hypothetical protein
MNSPHTILLFDLDGVLVQPLGYRAALRATLEHFLTQLGLDHQLIPRLEVIELFEGMHITSEWDMVPLILGEILNQLVKNNPRIRLPEKVTQFSPLQTENYLREVDYLPLLEALSPNLDSNDYPANTALRLSTHPELFDNSGKIPPFFHIRSTNLLSDLLAHTREPDRSATTRYFQHYTLGSDTYSQVYGCNPDFQTGSLLVKNDIPQLSPILRDKILEQWRDGCISLAAITNRPSAPPREINHNYPGYAPEAELALDLNGLGEIPLIGFGRIRYFADKWKIAPETLIKPSPFQGIAAIIAALGRNELQSLQTSHTIMIDGQSNHLHALMSGMGCVDLPPFLNIHIFEDTRWGIQSVQQAGSILETLGVPNKVFAWGITSSAPKAKSLQDMGAIIYGDVSAAIQAVVEIS